MLNHLVLRVLLSGLHSQRQVLGGHSHYLKHFRHHFLGVLAQVLKEDDCAVDVLGLLKI